MKLNYLTAGLFGVFFAFNLSSAQADAPELSNAAQAKLYKVHDVYDGYKDKHYHEHDSYKKKKYDYEDEDEYEYKYKYKKKHKGPKFDDDGGVVDNDHYNYKPYYHAKKPWQVRRILRRKGFHGIRFTDRKLPLYKLKACKHGLRYQIYVKYNGKIKRKREIGYCSTGNRHRDYWRSPRHFY